MKHSGIEEINKEAKIVWKIKSLLYITLPAA